MSADPIEKIPTGIQGFDAIAGGGLPAGRTTLVSGSPGSAKTIFAGQFLAAGVAEQGAPAVFVTCEEPPFELRRNLQAFGWDIPRWEQEGWWSFVDASPDVDPATQGCGGYDLGGFMARVRAAAERTGAKRIVIDSLGGMFSRFPEAQQIRWDLYRVSGQLKQLGITTLMTAERDTEYGPIARYGVEAFIADNVVILRNILEAETRRHTVEILKFRGAAHQKGEYPFTLVPDTGLVVLPRTAPELPEGSLEQRVTTGNEELDAMCDGGFYRGSVVLVSGATGTGKTLMATEFISGGLEAGERCLLFAFEESRQQLVRNARGWGVDYEPAEVRGDLQIYCEYPETAGLENHLIRIKEAVETFQPHRVALDSLTALERVATPRSFREFVISLASFLKGQQVTSLLTSSATALLGGTSVTEARISTLTDALILLRYAEIDGEVQRGLTVLKIRGAAHEKSIRAFTIDSRGMRVGDRFRGFDGILEGRTNRSLEPGRPASQGPKFVT